MNYIIVKANSLEELEKSVNAKIDEGYTPTGGILVQSERVRKDASGVNPGGNWETVVWYIQGMTLIKIKTNIDDEFKQKVLDMCGIPKEYRKQQITTISKIEADLISIWENISKDCPYRYIKDCTDTSRFDIAGDQSIPMPCSADRCSYAKIKEEYENKIKKTTFEII